MLFNSFEFLFLFLPATLLVYYLLRHWVAHHAALIALTIASLVFYSWWDIRYLPLLLGSIIINHLLGLVIAKRGAQPWLAIGIIANLASIGLFKYADFFIGNIIKPISKISNFCISLLQNSACKVCPMSTDI